MGSPNLTDEQKVMRYPPSILAWERKHGIARYEKNGVQYICGVRPNDEIFDSIRRERRENWERSLAAQAAGDKKGE